MADWAAAHSPHGQYSVSGLSAFNITGWKRRSVVFVLGACGISERSRLIGVYWGPAGTTKKLKRKASYRKVKKFNSSTPLDAYQVFDEMSLISKLKYLLFLFSSFLCVLISWIAYLSLFSCLGLLFHQLVFGIFYFLFLASNFTDF